MIPYGMGQEVKFKKILAELGEIDLKYIINLGEDEFTSKLSPIYKLLRI